MADKDCPACWGTGVSEGEHGRTASCHCNPSPTAKDDFRGIIYEMDEILLEERTSRSWDRVRLLAENVRTVLRAKL